MLHKTILFLLTIFFVFTLTSCLYCYQCRLKDGVGDEGCDGSPPDDKYLRECAEPQCWLRYSTDGTQHVERFCVAVADNSNGCMHVMVEDNYGREHSGIECKCSRHDGCNMLSHRSHTKHHGSVGGGWGHHHDSGGGGWGHHDSGGRKHNYGG